MESWTDKHVTGQRKTSTEDTRPPPIQRLSDRKADEVASHGEVQAWSPDRIFEDTEEALQEDEEETQLQIGEIYVPSEDEDNVPIVQTLRADVCPPHKLIPKGERAVGQTVAKQFQTGLFRKG
jgi:hypothetical protein